MASAIDADIALRIEENWKIDKSLNPKTLKGLATARTAANRDKTPRVEPAWVGFAKEQLSQVVKNTENGWKSKEALERTVMRPRQVLYQDAI